MITQETPNVHSNVELDGASLFSLFCANISVCEYIDEEVAMRSVIVATGMFTPDPCDLVTNAEVEAWWPEREDWTTADWLVKHTQIEQRYHVGRDVATSDLAAQAAQMALDNAEITADELDLILVGTNTPDYPVPGTATTVQRKLGASCFSFDVNSGCSGFMTALKTGNSLVRTGEHRLVLVVGADKLAHMVNFQDRGTAPLLGDGAGAVILAPSDDDSTGIEAFVAGSDGSGVKDLLIPAGGTAKPLTPAGIVLAEGMLSMNGKRVYANAIQRFPEAILELARKTGIEPDDLCKAVKQVILHQANGKIIETSAERSGVPLDMCFMNLDRYANTGAGSVPIALHEAVEQKKVQEGDRIILAAFGAGYSWVACMATWAY